MANKLIYVCGKSIILEPSSKRFWTRGGTCSTTSVTVPKGAQHLSNQALSNL